MLWGLAAMIAVILLIDQLVWRPAIAWSSKFKFEQMESADVPTSPILHILRNSNALRVFREKTVEPLEREAQPLLRPPETRSRSGLPCPGLAETARFRSWRSVAIGAVGYSVVRAFALFHSIDSAEIRGVLKGAGATFLRVTIAPHRFRVDHSRRCRHRL